MPLVLERHTEIFFAFASGTPSKLPLKSAKPVLTTKSKSSEA